VNALYADRFQAALDIFQKLLAVNPNNTEATYWLGQTYLDMDDNASARQVYEKALMASANAPLILVGMGHVELLEKKTNEARQRFETALTMTRTKKGDDPVILNAIGRANVDAKAGDLAYAIEKLKAAAEKDPKNPDIFLNLGNAYRKAKPGEGGGDAYINYKKALEINPNFVYANVRIAKLFESQQNWEIVLDNLNEAVKKDPKFSLAYQELFNYYYWHADFTNAEKYLNQYIESKLPEKDINDDYLYAQLCYLKKDYDCVISKDLHVVDVMGTKTKPKVYKALAYSYLEKKDTATGRKYVDLYFAKEKPEEVIPPDYVLKANAYANSGDIDMIVKAYVDASITDTTLSGKVDWLKKGAELLKSKGERVKEVELRRMVYTTKPSPTNLDIFNWGLAAYFAGNFALSDSVFGLYSAKYPTETFGWQWQGRSRARIDTTMEQGLAVAPYQTLLSIADQDRVKYKAEFIEAAGYLAGYSNNILKNKDSALVYVNKILEVDPANEQWKKTQDILLKMPAPKQNNSKGGTTSKPNGKLNKEKIFGDPKKALAKR
jgi:tetratricopeptide (TPR) repeat protein